MTDNNKYNKTIFLPKTKFSMRANLPLQEPLTIEFWKKIDLWKLLRQNSADKEKFVLHDGPPYANGPIHMGTATNKVLKDIINRIMQAEGFNSLYVPGWDCHGLPIEWQVEKNFRKKGIRKEDIPIKEFRNECREFALKWIEEQKNSFIRLFVLADWEKPYLTMDFDSEAVILKEFSKFLIDGSLYRGTKPVMWSPVEKTALAEAEIEYKNIISKSIYVSFNIRENNKGFKDMSIIIWTTTPWTIPGNQAIAFGKKIKYSSFEIIKSNNTSLEKKKYIVATSLLEKVKTDCSINELKVIDTFDGSKLNGLECYHPFYSKGYTHSVPLLDAKFVEDNEGSGFVHIAPAYGEDDYNLAKENNISVTDIVNDNGTYKEDVPLFKDIHVFKVQDEIIEKLYECNGLIGNKIFEHSYPHSWRSKKPIIYRATPQWFISMGKNKLRVKALESIENTAWVPYSSKKRIKSMVEGRPDWCVSRQRAWGVPLTIFINKKTGEPLKDPVTINKVIDDVRKKGSDVWLSEDPYKYLNKDKKPEDYKVVRDILDVWFDSGSTHAFVLEEKLKWPADLYLEGTDQHRGFFQSSLLEACATRNTAPFKTVLTHGFVLDGKGKKMSKSVGNVISPENIIKKSGADILRLWVSTTDCTDDMRISDEIISNLNDYYRRIRNTFRYMLGILENSEKTKFINEEEISEIDKFILGRIYELDQIRKKAIKEYIYHNFYKALFDFCTVDLSAFYFDISKDMLYCDRLSSKYRQARLKTIYIIYDILTFWYSPVLCHTMEETWSIFKTENKKSVHLRVKKDIKTEWRNPDLLFKWNKIKKIRKIINSAIEEVRNDKKIGSSLETEVHIYTNSKELENILKSVNMKTICIVSEFFINIENNVNKSEALNFLQNNEEELEVYVFKSKHRKCLRCWQYKSDVDNETGLCNRCKEAIA